MTPPLVKSRFRPIERKSPDCYRLPPYLDVSVLHSASFYLPRSPTCSKLCHEVLQSPLVIFVSLVFYPCCDEWQGARYGPFKTHAKLRTLSSNEHLELETSANELVECVLTGLFFFLIPSFAHSTTQLYWITSLYIESISNAMKCTRLYSWQMIYVYRQEADENHPQK